jgi:Concanavalin A-like lectin/glucanases superfamily/IPT/TIG domain
MNKKEIIASNFKLLIIALITAVSVFMIASFLLSCSKDNETNPAPTITSFSPSSGLVGATVVITGTNFSSTAANNTVKVTNASATVTAATSTQLTITVPPNTTTGKITVSVNGLTATSATDFTILLPSPTITNFSPLGAVPGSSLVITGTNFRTILNENTVKVNGVFAIVTAATSTQLTVTIPAGATTGKVAVEINGVTATSVSDFEVLKDIPRTGLIAFFPFTGNGISSNNSSLNLPISDINQPTLTADRYGKSGQALNFNGTQVSQTQRVIPNRPWTICVWMDPGTFNNVWMGFMASHQGASGIAFRFGNNSSGDFVIEVNGQNPLGDYSLANSVGQRYIPGDGIETKWFLISMTYDGSVFKVYKDNLEVYSSSITADTPTEDYFALGSAGIYDSGYKYIGKMDDLTIYNRVLTTQELTQVFQQTVSKY